MSERIVVLFAVAVGGSLGALVRYSLAGWLVRRFPMGTLVVNVAGCLLIGLIAGSLKQSDWLSPAWRHFLVMGMLGSLTTFSTFGYQTIELAWEGQYALAAFNVLTNILVGFAAVAAGLMLGHALTLR